jgi:tetratricopeptide (TPR) repeat protein
MNSGMSLFHLWVEGGFVIQLTAIILLGMSVAEDPYNDRNAYYYARELYFHGLAEESEKEFKRHLSMPTSTWAPERAWSMRYLAKMQTNHLDALEWLDKANKQDPRRREPLVDYAMIAHNNSMWKECLEAAEKAILIQEKPLDYLCEEFAWGSAVYDYAAIASYNLGQFDKALEYGKKAVELSPTDVRLQGNLKFYIG